MAGAWAVRAVELPFGTELREWWLDASGRSSERPLPNATPLPGRYALTGLVDAHAHPGLAPGSSGPIGLEEAALTANLVAWAASGVTLIRDVGSRAGLTLTIHPPADGPHIEGAGRFLAPAGRYFAELLPAPVSEEELVAAALAEIGRGATWVKLVADFPKVPEFTDVARTYPLEVVAEMCAAVHDAGARVAAHATLPDVGPLVEAGIDSVEHGTGMDRATLEVMAARGVAWTPTLCAVFGQPPPDDVPEEHRRRWEERRERVATLLPQAVRLGVPVLAGTDVVGSIPQEVALLARMGLQPAEALAAASVWGRNFIAGEMVARDVVTYADDPRDDPAILARPAAVVRGGIRIR